MRLKLTLTLAAGALAIAGQAHALHPAPLVEAEWLDEQRGSDNLVILDVRSSIDDGGDRDAFEAARIPGSRYSSYTDAGWRETRDGVPGLMPAVDDLEALISELGISNDDTVVVVAGGTGPTDFGSATRVYWTFRALGHDHVTVLNGGFAGWQQQGFETASGAPSAPASAHFSATLQPELLASSSDVERARQSDTTLVDARPAPFYSGETQSPVTRAPGTIPGAVNLPHDSALEERDGAYYLVPERLTANIEALGLAPDAPIIAFCNTGHWAASGWFQLNAIGGLESTTMYDGSMADWTQDDARQIQLAERGIITVGELAD